MRSARAFNDALKAFEIVNRKRNRFVHGLWYTHTDTNTVYLSDDLKHQLPIMRGKEIVAADVEIVVKEIMQVEKRLRDLFRQELQARIENAEKAGS